MAESFGWGLLGSSSLVLGGLIVMWRPIGSRLLGLVMAFADEGKLVGIVTTVGFAVAFAISSLE